MYASSIPQVSLGSPVRKVMMWPISCVDTQTSLAAVAEALAADEIGVVCVIGNGRIAGIVSERDLVAHVAAGADLTHLSAAEVMSADLVTVSPEDSVLDAALRMEDAQVRHLPVIDDGRIAGIVSMRDLFSVFAHGVRPPRGE